MTNNMEQIPKPQASKLATQIVASLTSFMTPLMLSSVSIALPSIGKEFQVDAVLLTWVPTSYMLAAAMFLVPLGRLADIHGMKKVFTYGMWVYLVSSVLMVYTPSAVALIALRGVQGIGVAMIFGTSMAILTSVFPLKERGKALGVNVGFTYVALSVGPLFGGFMTEHLGWRSIFWVVVALAAITLVVVYWKLKGEWAPARGRKFDVTGAVVYSLALLVLMTGVSMLPQPTGFALIAVGTVALAAFVLIELRKDSPVLDVRLFKGNRSFAFSNLASLINYSAVFAVTFLISLYLQYNRGFSPEHAGLLMIVQPVFQAACSPFAGRLSDKIEPRIVATAGMGLCVVGLTLFTFIGQDTSLWYLAVALGFLGIGFGLFSSPNSNAIVSSVDKKVIGVAAAISNTMRVMGQMFSMGITMLVFAIIIGRVQITAEYFGPFLNSLHLLFGIFTLLCVAGMFCSLSRGKVRQPGTR
jgi:EmrB/QacA subfamily drug resistance transporter